MERLCLITIANSTLNLIYNFYDGCGEGKRHRLEESVTCMTNVRARSKIEGAEVSTASVGDGALKAISRLRSR